MIPLYSIKKNEFAALLHGVEHLYSKILLRNRVERGSGVGVDPYTRSKTGPKTPLNHAFSWAGEFNICEG